MRFQPFTAAIALTPLLCAFACPRARAADAPKTDNLLPSAPEAQSELWQNAPLGKVEIKAVDQSQFTDAATQQISLVAGLRDWRDTLDGRGKFASRDLLSGQVLGSKARFSLGRVAPPALAGVGGAGAGVTAQWGALEIGSTLRPRALDEQLVEFDRAFTGKKAALADEQSVTWLRAKPLQGKNADLELNISQAQRAVATGAVAAGDAVKMREGVFMGAGGGLSLPMNWKFRGNYARAAMKDAPQHKSSWSAKLGGPISHPLGKANVEVEWRETDAGYTTLNQSDPNGGAAGAARLTQDIKTDALTGHIKIAATQKERGNLAAAKTGDTLENRDANGAADLKLKVTPNLSLRANGAVGAAQVVRAGANFADSLQAEQTNAAPAMSTEETATQGGDVGVEWNLNKELAFSATVGTSQSLGWRDCAEAPTVWTPFNQSAENRLGFELSHRDKDGVLLAKYAARARDEQGLAAWQRLETVRLQAERPLLFGMKVKTIVDLARGGAASWADESSVARRVEAQLQFTRAARIDLNFRDGAALPGQWLADPLSAPFRGAGGGAWNAGDKQFGARINAGSAAGGNGLGLALEYARQQHKGSDNDQWRVGLTWK